MALPSAYFDSFSREERQRALLLAVYEGLSVEEAFERVAADSLASALESLSPALGRETHSISVKWLDGKAGVVLQPLRPPAQQPLSRQESGSQVEACGKGWQARTRLYRALERHFRRMEGQR